MSIMQSRKSGHIESFLILLILGIIGGLSYSVLHTLGYPKAGVITALIITSPLIILCGLSLLFSILLNIFNLSIWIGNKLGWEWAVEIIKQEEGLNEIR